MKKNVTITPGPYTADQRKAIQAAYILAAALHPYSSREDALSSASYDMDNYPGDTYAINLDGKPVGGAHLDNFASYLDPNKKDSWKEQTGVEITDLGIHKKYQGQGIGSAALRALTAEAGRRAKEKHRPYVYIGYLNSNPRAGSLYKRLGFGDDSQYFDPMYDKDAFVELRLPASKAVKINKKANININRAIWFL